MKVLGFRVSGLRVPVLRLGGLGPRRWRFVQDLARGACPDRRIWIFASKHWARVCNNASCLKASLS